VHLADFIAELHEMLGYRCLQVAGRNVDLDAVAQPGMLGEPPAWSNVMLPSGRRWGAEDTSAGADAGVGANAGASAYARHLD
jgi:hypothetical protein